MAKPDWEAIETAYRAGELSLRDIAAQHGISEGAIRKRAAKSGWVRNKKNGTQVRKSATQKTSRTTAKPLRLAMEKSTQKGKAIHRRKRDLFVVRVPPLR